MGRFTPRIDPILFVKEAGWAPDSAWTGVGGGRKPLPLPLGFDPRNVQPVAKSLYRLRCPGPQQ